MPFPTIFTPQGDGNIEINKCIYLFFGFLNSRQYLPRKGTETRLQWRYLLGCSRWFIPDNIYPARGRKLKRKLLTLGLSQYLNSRQYLPRKGTETQCLYLKLKEVRSRIPDNIYPARGRKQYGAHLHSRHTYLQFPTIFTPQGDGNVARV